MKKITLEEFIERAEKIHNNRYDYFNSVYVNSWTKICIVCPIHGIFYQTPDNHIYRKSGCPNCKKLAIHIRCNKGINQFISDAKKIHGNVYDYSKSIYITSHKKLEIVCRKHGDFWQTPNNHLSGKGCSKCGNGTKTAKEFVCEASKIHGDKYCYDNINYVDLTTKLPILCKIHGIFNQTPNAHLKGQGCPKCKKSKGENLIEKFLKDNNILYECSKAFSSCKNPKTEFNLYYDFYLPSENILIEYDGYQHYYPYFKDGLNLDSLKKRQFRDKIKTEWANKNNVELIRIKYSDIGKIEKILNEKLKSGFPPKFLIPK